MNALPRNSVGAVQLRNNAVNSRKVKNGALLAVDFKGDKGDTGPNPAATAIVRQAPGPPSTTTSEALVSCQSDERAVGGGAAWSTSSGGGIPAVITDMPTPGGDGTIPTGWRAVIRNMASVGSVAGRVFVVCVKK